MKIAFFITAAVMLAAALALVLIPLIRQGRRSGRGGSIFALVLAMAFVLPVSAGGLYLLIGTPAALNGVAARSAPPMSMDQAISELSTHLAEQPDDAKGWMLLAQTRTMQREPQAARDAYDRALKLEPNNAEAMIGWAESDSMLSDQHLIDGRALALLKRAVLLHPDSQRGLWLLGIGNYQHGNYADAAAIWRLLQPQLEPGSAVAQAVAEQIVKADARAGGTAAPAVTTSTAAALEVDVTLSPSLHSKLAPGDTLFVYARTPTGSPMPLAVARLDAATLPVKVTLDDAMAMTPSMKLSSVKQVFVGARISHAGQPVARPGDLEGNAGIVPVDSQSPIKITIDKVH
ncbi:MAG: tetratricopeptide repeat protein [Pseudomonadota bacterium]|nr:tetratricopeptide repeat protein [Pseudomonadota bacterium]